MAERTCEIGGSDARRIMAGEAQAVWEELTGRREREDLTNSLPVQIGAATEAVNRRYYEHKTGLVVHQVQAERPSPLPSIEIVGADAIGVKVRSTAFPWMTAHLDGLVERQVDGALGVWEGKHTHSFDWNDAEAIAELNWWQGCHYAVVTGLNWVEFSVLGGTVDWGRVTIEVGEDHQLQLLGALNRFRRCVLTDTPPVPAVVPPPPVPRLKVYTEQDLRALPIANAFGAHAGVLVETWDHAERHEAALADLKGLAFPEDAKRVEGFGITIGIAKNGAKTVKRAKAPPAAAA